MIAVAFGLTLAAIAWSVVLPGLLAADLALPGSDGVERWAVGLALGLGLVPVLCFGLAMLFATVPSKALVLAVATALNAALFVLLRRRSG